MASSNAHSWRDVIRTCSFVGVDLSKGQALCALGPCVRRRDSPFPSKSLWKLQTSRRICSARPDGRNHPDSVVSALVVQHSYHVHLVSPAAPVLSYSLLLKWVTVLHTCGRRQSRDWVSQCCSLKIHIHTFSLTLFSWKKQSARNVNEFMLF